MNLVFMNSLEKETAPGRFKTAIVSIVEEGGLHQIHWREPNEQGRHIQELWYEGANWEEMLMTFRHRVTEKMADGYVPVIDRMPPRPDQLSPAARLIQKQVFYSEQYCNNDLYEQLRTWRRERAAKEAKAPFLIGNNRLLRLIAAFVPHSPEELLQLPGFGRNKLDGYGEEILAFTRRVPQPKPFPLHWVEEAIDEEAFLEWLYAQKELKFKAEAEQLARKKQLLQAMQEGASLEQLEAALSVPARELVIMIERLDNEGYDLAAWIERELAQVDASEREQAMRMFDKLGDRYLKPVLETIYTVTHRQTETDKLYIRLRLLRMQYRRRKTLADEERAG
jgi:hypothetical protein